MSPRKNYPKNRRPKDNDEDRPLNPSNQSFEEDSGLDNELYAAHGGGFPITVSGSGMVGVALVSGLPQVEDHKMIIQGLTNFKQAKN